MRFQGLLCFCLILAGCSPPQSEVIRFGLASGATNLDPRFATDAASERINRLIYEQLVDFDDQARPVAALANWQKISDRQYRFTLQKPGRTFHDGSRLDAKDVVATYRSILDPATASPHRATLSMIERIEAVNAGAVDFFLNRSDALFPAYLTIGILPESGIANDISPQRQPVGSGPFRFQAWPHSGRLELVRIRDQQGFAFEEVRDPTMRVLKLLRGEIDLLQSDLPPELVQYLSDRADIRLHTRPGTNFVYLGFQLEDRDTGRWLVRRAIALAIDRQAIIRHVFHGAARPASALLSPEHWAGAKSLPVIERDLEQAKVLLQKAGYSWERPLRLTYKTSSDPFRIRVATILQQQLAQVGIQVDVKSYDWGTFYGDIKAGRFQMYSLAWVGVKSPDIFRYAFHSKSLPPAGANRGRFRDVKVDQWIERAMAAPDLSQQALLYVALQQYLLERLPYIPLWYEDQFFVARNDIQGYTLAADGNYDALADTFKTAGGSLR